MFYLNSGLPESWSYFVYYRVICLHMSVAANQRSWLSRARGWDGGAGAVQFHSRWVVGTGQGVSTSCSAGGSLPFESTFPLGDRARSQWTWWFKITLMPGCWNTKHLLRNYTHPVALAGTSLPKSEGSTLAAAETRQHFWGLSLAQEPWQLSKKWERKLLL